ncbi:hypothetical protein HS088_TW04G01298 [Tripterygium wilfordii]|uniref:EDRF1 N-terminal domain-containing protein n=1 Tax=Tripterygium wilfordii TaxID=458696 RepID=A0A7J7DSI6_TRIWF|nr:uncharacterized protein LOC119997222 [Tripterygium wilfordii]XP_038700026.1 uncharacterized protein LOC119997222 [Tripterygium wilfordii]XP_038700027.1 uncharacterized protein LOC119997222 [Tripterygium wilfordii]KAF5749330.1 hypothetical protein HS088_TW04G01298 [Tripterygium wilfordii]
MDTPPSPPYPASPSSSIDGSRELQCVGRLEIVRPKPVGFLCGSIPVPTDNSFHSFNSDLVPSAQTVSAPRYRMLPNETDLNMPPVVLNSPEKVLPLGAFQSKTSGELTWEDSPISSNITRKCDALAVSGLVEYGDEIDVIAPADIVKQIFKMPYSKARLSIAVRRIGRTLVLNTGPDVEEGEKLVRRHNSQSNCTDQSLFLNFAMHSVRMEACDCPPTHQSPPEEQSNSSVLCGGDASQFMREINDASPTEGFSCHSDYAHVKQDDFFWRGKKKNRNRGRDPVKKASHIGEKPRFSVKESEKYKRVRNDEFLRVLFWQFHNFRMLLGSDLLLFTNEKYAAVSLHLWDVKRQVTPLTWLEAWLDNVMANVPEVAICYHQDGVVQGYELLKTDDIFLLKGISEDGTPAFHPYVVQQNGLSVFRFLQENCKQDPGAYWLYKSTSEDALQLFDLSDMPKNHSSGNCDDNSSRLPSLLHNGRSDSFFSLGTLLYRIAHRLSLSMAPNDRAKCAVFFKKCLQFLDEPDHLVLRALAHEQYARLILNYDEELKLTSDCVPVGYEVTVIDADDESFNSSNIFSESAVRESFSSVLVEEEPTEDSFHDLVPETYVNMTLEANVSTNRELIGSTDFQLGDAERTLLGSKDDENLAVCKMSATSRHVVQTVTDPISSKLAAVHHVSQAIKSLRWMREVQSTEPEVVFQESSSHDRPSLSMNFSVCACGDAECIEVCDIWEWLPTSKLDNKMWKLVLLLGESYLALGEAYKEDKQLHQALKVVELSCSMYGSMPQHLEDTQFISSMVRYSSSPNRFNDMNEKPRSYIGDAKEVNSCPNDDCLTLDRCSSTDLFWAKAWILVGDVYAEFHIIESKESSTQSERKQSFRELKVPSEIVKEVKRLKKKLGQYGQNCSSCSLVNCSCKSDRANSGSSASSSSGDMRSVGRKHSKKSHGKSSLFSLLEDRENDHVHPNTKHFDSQCLLHSKDGNTQSDASEIIGDRVDVNALRANGWGRLDGSPEMQDADSSVTSHTEIASRVTSKANDGGIFKYLKGPLVGDPEHNLLDALRCYEEAKNTLGVLPSGSAEVQSVNKKRGWVCNELGRIRLERKDLMKAELAFKDAINSFREVSDHTNIILINCNLGHGRRALAEEMVAKLGHLKTHSIFHNDCKQALEIAKLEYSESLRFYGAAKSEINDFANEGDPVFNSLRNEVYTQFAHTYLRLGMLLAGEDVTAKVFENGALEDTSVGCSPRSGRRSRRELRKREISANDAIREALVVYESLGDLRKQEAAYAYFQLACHQRDSCLKLLESNWRKSSLPKGENVIPQRVKQYALLAERNWQKAMDFYGPETHPTMYLTILMERSALSSSLSNTLHSNAMMESALSRLLEGRYIPETTSASFKNNYPEVHAKFWSQLQMLLKQMLVVALSSNTNKSSASNATSVSNRFGDTGNLRELYKMSLKSTEMSDLQAMHALWAS